MKTLNEILNSILFKFNRREMRYKIIIKDIEILLRLWCLERKKFEKNKFEKNIFPFFLFGKCLNIFQFGIIIQMTTHWWRTCGEYCQHIAHHHNIKPFEVAIHFTKALVPFAIGICYDH